MRSATGYAMAPPEDLRELRTDYAAMCEQWETIDYERRTEKANVELHKMMLACHRRIREIVVIETWRDVVEFEDFVWCLEQLSIKDKKTGVTIPFKLKPLQIKTLKRFFYEKFKKRIPCRYQILKSRQWGGTTLCEMICYLKQSVLPGNDLFIIGCDDENADHIFEMYHRAWEEDVIRRPKVNPRAIRTLQFSDGAKGKVTIKSGYGIEQGRGFTNMFSHLSECAFYRGLAKLLVAALPALPESEHAMFGLESTGNGKDNEFCVRWYRPSEFLKIFCGWIEDPDCVRSVTEEERAQIMDSLDTKEKFYVEELGATAENIKFRRVMIENIGSEEDFMQEFPATPEEAFQASGREVFSVDKINELGVLRTKWMEHRPKTDNTRNQDRMRYYNVKIIKHEDNPLYYRAITFTDKANGELEVYQNPLKGKSYLVSFDTAEGKDINAKTLKANKQAEADNSVLQVWNYDDSFFRMPVMVAEYCSSSILPTTFGYLVSWIAARYNYANIIGENNAAGATVFEALTMRDSLVHDKARLGSVDKTGEWRSVAYPKSRIYKRSDYEFGWRTSAHTTRPLMFASLRETVEEVLTIITSKKCLDELSFLIKGRDGKEQAPGGRHDDRVIAFCLAIRGLIEMRPPLNPEKSVRNALDDRIRDLSRMRKVGKGKAVGGWNVV